MPAASQTAGSQVEDGAERKDCLLMWGYLPVLSLQRGPLNQPTPAPPPALGEGWTAVCGGGCGYAVGISDSGKVHTWGSAAELSHAQLSSEKQQVRPEPCPLPEKAYFVTAAAGWAHCVAATRNGEVYTWGWSECVPHSKPEREQEEPVASTGKELRKRAQPEQLAVKGQGKTDVLSAANDRRSDGNKPAPTAASSRSQAGGSAAKLSTSRASEKTPAEISKKRRIGSPEEAPLPESTSGSEETVSAPPCLVNLGVGCRIVSVAAGGRHTLALSDTGKVWGWGYGGEGQLGLGTRLRTVSNPQVIPCFESESSQLSPEKHVPSFPGSRITAIACGGRHSAVITDAGALLTFGWGLYGQCGQGSTDDELQPSCVADLAGLRVTGVAAGLWHTLCITDCGATYAFGGNQFGQLGVGGDRAEMTPKLIEGRLDEEVVVSVDCGARHSVVLTDSGKVFCWGWNKYGQLGLGDTVDRDTPDQMQLGVRVKSIACGWWHTLALASGSKQISSASVGHESKYDM